MYRFFKTIESLSPIKILILAVAGSFFLYGNTLWNNYALDDAIVITKNEFTKKGVQGIPKIFTTDSFTGFFGVQKELVSGGRYRPLSIATFALEYQIYGAKPVMSHLWNILIYASIILLCYWVVIYLIKDRETPFPKTIAWATAFLFMIHPLHTEVVANIKGRDELLSLLFSLIAFLGSLNFRTSMNWKWLLLSGVSIFLALMSKENALAFIFIIPFALFYFSKITYKQFIPILISLVIPSLIFIAIRYKILGGFSSSEGTELMNNPFLEATTGQKYATILYTWLIYLKLLFFPHPLTFDYYPYHIPLVSFKHPAVLFLLIILVGFCLFAYRGFKYRNITTFSIIGFGTSFLMVSNLFFPVGTFMNERFLFMPSFFWCLAIASILISLDTTHNWFRFYRGAMLLITSLLIGFYIYKTIDRNKDWKDDLTLFTTDVKTSSQSAKSNCSAGGKLWEYGKTVQDSANRQKIFQQSEIYLTKAVSIHPTYADAWLLLGNLQFDYKKQIEASAQSFLNVMQWQPANETAWQNFDIVLQNTSDRKLQLEKYEQAFKIDANRYLINYRLGVLYGRYFSNLNKSIEHLEKATKIDPSKNEALKDLGTAYGISGNIPKAYETLKQALFNDSTDTQIYNNLIVTCRHLGLHAEANEYIRKTELLKNP